MISLILTGLLTFGGVIADVAVGEAGIGAQPGDQMPRICVDHRDVIIGWDADPVGINALDYRSGLYAFTGEQIEFTILVRDPNGALDIGFPKIVVDNSPEVLCNELSDALVYHRTDTLCYKSSSTNWQCGTDPENPSSAGTVTYVERNGVLEVVVSLTGLKPNQQYQLTLQGRNGNDGNDELGNNCENPSGPAEGYTCTWECGFSMPNTRVTLSRFFHVEYNYRVPR